ncbi:MAG: hypothetical protein JW973_05220 [Bacteroidales bacterium]|nr:hypothetical protein [Bacteroidales bacterium]
MKTIPKFLASTLMVVSMGILTLSAQNEIIFSPAELIPHDDGYYIAGVYLDLNEDGTPEFYNGCFDGYENYLSPQDNHHECGTQQNFTYISCMIMPTCTHKSTPIEPPVPDGYIQMAPSLYLGTDSASISAVLTPAIVNLQSLFMETSSDVSINEQRKIPYNIEYSKDNGLTWENNYISDFVAAQGGYRVTYTSESHLEFEEMVNASKDNPIVLRISTNDVSLDRPIKGQYVKIHSIKIMADMVSSIDDSRIDNNKLNLKVNNRTLFADNSIKVYNSLGQFMGSGKQVSLPSGGIYIVLSSNGALQKIYIE